jgi:tetratricopeptide (TPR) repeat protein
MKKGKKPKGMRKSSQQPSCLRQSGEIKPAAHKMDSNQPESIKSLEKAATKCINTRNYIEAIRIYQQLSKSQPGCFSHPNNIGNILALLGDYTSAIQAFKHAINLAPLEVDAYTNLANIYNANSDLDEAEKIYNVILNIKPNHAPAVSGIATILEKRGEYEVAYNLLKPILQASDPDITAVAAFSSIARHIKEENKAIKYIALKLHKRKTANHYRVALLFGLGDLYHRIRDYDSAFRSVFQGARLRGNSYNPKQAEKLVDDIITTFSKDFLRSAPKSEIYSGKPLFILGMPRSGTTLTEQIISSHPDVFGAGEILDLSRIIERIQGYPASVRNLDVTTLSQFASGYLNSLHELSASAKYVTDKLPINFLNLGMIELLFPGARVVHCARNPMDTCLSCYFQLFTHANEFSYDLENLGHFYALYQKLMAHWENVLSIRYYDQSYEELVYNQHESSRKLIDFCGLEWDEKCIDFHQSGRVIKTASYYQVRQPMYKQAIDKWRKYEKHLGPLKNALRN